MSKNEYVVLSHIKGDKAGCYVVTELLANSDDEAQSKFRQLLSARQEVPGLHVTVYDTTTLVKVIEKRP